MSLLQEASVDDLFNTQLGKIQAAIEKLEQVVTQFTPANRPISSQVRSVEIAAEDLVKLAKQLKELRDANR